MIEPGCEIVADFKMSKVNTRRLHSDTKSFINTKLLHQIAWAQLIRKIKEAKIFCFLNN